VIRGVHTSTIVLVSTASLQAATTPELIALCRAWIPLNLSEPYICGGKMFDAYIKTLIANNINTVVPPTRGRCLSTEECAEFFDVCIQNGKTEGLSTGTASYVNFLRQILPGRAFFTTSDSHIGLCPANARTGDHVCVVLGSNAPLVLRPVPDLEGRYQVVGECSVHGLMFGVALLGPPPNLWQARFAIDNLLPRTKWFHDGW
jgi:hypothetical protein